MERVRSNISFIRAGHAAQVGITTSLEAALEFNDWARSLHGDLSAALIQQRYQCSRATSYRWLAAFRDVTEKRAFRSAA